jgi:hypothetical protein
MVQRRHRARFALEALRELLFYNLDCDNAIQPRVASTIDFAHAAGANGCEEFIWAQPSSSSQGHRLSNDCTVREKTARAFKLTCYLESGPLDKSLTLILSLGLLHRVRFCIDTGFFRGEI